MMSLYNGILLTVFFIIFLVIAIFRTKVITIWKERSMPKIDVKPYLDKISELEINRDELDKELYIMRMGEKILGHGSWLWDLTVSPDRVYYSENFAVIFSVQVGEILTGEQLMAKIHIADILEVKRVIKEAHMAGVPYSMDYRIGKLNRRVDSVKVHGEPILSESGKTIRAVGTIQYLSTVFD